MLHEIILRRRNRIAGVVLFSVPGHSGLWHSVKEAISLDGWHAIPSMARRFVEHRWNCLRHSPPHFSSVDRLLARHRLEAVRFARPNLTECVEHVAALEPDVIVNFQPWYLKGPILRCARKACLNMHTAALPKYRGVQPVVRALLAGDDRIGVSIHTMVDQIDAGAIAAQASVPRQESVFDCYKRTFELVPDLLDDALRALESGTILAEIDSSTPYFGPLTQEEKSEFRRRGLRYL